MRLLLFIFIFVAYLLSPGQDTLVFLNGTHKTDIEFLRIYSNYIYYQKWRKDKPVQKIVHKDDVLAIYTPEGRYIISYLYDSLGTILDDKSMMQYISGMELAWDKYHNYFVPALSFTLSAGSGIWPGIPWGIIVPVTIPAVVNFFKVQPRHLSYLNENQRENYYFVRGGLDVAKTKILRSSVFGGIAGYATGMLLNIYLINPR